MVAEERPYLDAILAAPDDDAPRLVFADWLQARGDPRGELITVQCALENDGLPWPERQRLEARQRALLRENAAKWTVPLQEVRDGRYAVKRGFAHQARLPGHQPLRLGDLHALAPLLVHFAIVEARLTELALADWVEGVQLEYGLFDLGAIVRTLTFPKLRRLRLPAGVWETPDDVAHVAGLDRPLEYLSLDFDQRSDATHLEALKRGLATRRPLRALRLEGARGVGAVSVPGLEALELVRCDVKREDLHAMAAGLVKLELTESDLRHQQRRVEPIELLDAAPRLEHLRLEGVALDDDALVRLARSPHAPRLKSLNLSRNVITDYGAYAMMGAERFTSLRYLNLDVNELSRKVQAQLRKHFASAEVQAR